MDDEWEEEEQLVVVELSGMINSDFLTKCQGKLKVVGIDTEQPMIQVGNYVFAGEYEDALGTCVIFEESRDCNGDAESSPKLKYKCHTVKKLMMQRTFLAEKKEGESSTEGIEFLQLNDGEFRQRNNFICKFAQDPGGKVPFADLCAEAGSEVGTHSPGSESDGEVSDSEQVQQTNEDAESDSDPGSSVCKQTVGDLEASD
ncbi:general transcription factor 3C polypeptide 6 isoform X1 [Conger conger]|uniref:general transcription factor 3C polypeptide 6 isoform X1 n=2 Tax=Conger conger TaxID=82655 RepID=UPI002A59BD7E|nr:general transcription factor 3C polypeptide 6 isoform X1 [Conger conger]